MTHDKKKQVSSGSERIRPHIAIVISVLAIVVSFSNLYLTSLAPFDPLVLIGTISFDPLLQANRADAGTGERPSRYLVGITVAVPITAIHRGGRSGVVEDLVFRLKCVDTGSEWVFIPMLVADERAYVNGPVPADKWITSVFYPIPVPRGGYDRRLVLFSPDRKTATSAQPLTAGVYRYRVFARLAGHSRWSEVMNRTDTVSKEDLDSLANGCR